MDAFSLAKQTLPEGWISAAIGEPYLIKDELYNTFDIKRLIPSIIDNKIFEYTKPAGYDPLVKFLEDKHQAPVIISNGAKQACSSLFYAIKKIGKTSVFMNKPWWSLFPPLIKMHGLEQSPISHNINCAQLIVYPNNPAGGHDSLLDNDILYHSKKMGIPTIHDCAYYSKIYLPKLNKNLPKADVQVFTCSKLLGLSQLRVGYSVYNNTQLYNSVLEYMETTSVGVSILSQIFALNILKGMQDNPIQTTEFENNCFKLLQDNRSIVNTISTKILDHDVNQYGMFLWTKCLDLQAFQQAKISVADGKSFGQEGFIRMNLALPSSTIKEIVDRLNSIL